MKPKVQFSEKLKTFHNTTEISCFIWWGAEGVEIKQKSIVSDYFSDIKHQCVVFSTQFKFIDWCQVD